MKKYKNKPPKFWKQIIFNKKNQKNKHPYHSKEKKKSKSW